MSNEIKIIPDYQELVRQKEIDSTGKFIETKKSKSYKYKIKVVKEGLKMINRDKYEEFVLLCYESKSVGMYLFKVINRNKNRDCMLANSSELYTTSMLEKESKFNRSYINRAIKKLIDKGFLKRIKKNFMISPYVFYPYVSDLNLKILQEYWDNDFTISKEVIGSQVQVEVNDMMVDAKEFISISSSEFDKIKNVKELK